MITAAVLRAKATVETPGMIPVDRVDTVIRQLLRLLNRYVHAKLQGAVERPSTHRCRRKIANNLVSLTRRRPSDASGVGTVRASAELQSRCLTNALGPDKEQQAEQGRRPRTVAARAARTTTERLALAFFPVPNYGRSSTITTSGRGGADMPTKKVKKVVATRPVSKLDLTKPFKVSASTKPRSKSDVFATIAQHAGIHRRDVAAVFHVMSSLIKADLSKNGTGSFKVPGLMRITVVRKPVTKEHLGINPFTKEQVMFKAKPARNVVRVRPLRGLKEMV